MLYALVHTAISCTQAAHGEEPFPFFKAPGDLALSCRGDDPRDAGEEGQPACTAGEDGS